MPWGQAVKNWGQLAKYGGSLAGGAFTGKYGSTAAGAAWGAAGGGLWGMASGDTSVLGGMAMGAGMGVAGGRYGAAGATVATNTRKMGLGFGARATSQYMGNMLRRDVRNVRNWGTRQWSNKGFSWNKISSPLKGWGSGMGAGI